MSARHTSTKWKKRVKISVRDLLAGTEEWRSVTSIVDVQSPEWRLAGHENIAEQAITAVLKSQYIEDAPMEFIGENLFYSTSGEEYKRWLCAMRLDLPPDVWKQKDVHKTILKLSTASILHFNRWKLPLATGLPYLAHHL